MTKTHSEKKPDLILMAIVAALVLFGFFALSSASIVISQKQYSEGYYFLKHQIFFGFLPGLALLFFSMKINYKHWKKISVFLIFLSLVLLVMVFIPGLGVKSGGASRWLKLGFIPQFQPVEFLKISLII